MSARNASAAAFCMSEPFSVTCATDYTGSAITILERDYYRGGRTYINVVLDCMPELIIELGVRREPFLEVFRELVCVRIFHQHAPTWKVGRGQDIHDPLAGSRPMSSNMDRTEKSAESHVFCLAKLTSVFTRGCSAVTTWIPVDP